MKHLSLSLTVRALETTTALPYAVASVSCEGQALGGAKPSRRSPWSAKVGRGFPQIAFNLPLAGLDRSPTQEEHP